MVFFKTIISYCDRELKKARTLYFGDIFCLRFIDQPQSDVVVFAITYFHTYITLVTEWKYVIGRNDIIIFNTELENL